jgi:hypothetical protein
VAHRHTIEVAVSLDRPGYPRFVVSGSGCTGADAGAGFELQDAAGTGLTGDGMAAFPDGTWRLEIRPYLPSGQYRILARCSTSDGGGFAYEPKTVTVP